MASLHQRVTALRRRFNHGGGADCQWRRRSFIAEQSRADLHAASC